MKSFEKVTTYLLLRRSEFETAQVYLRSMKMPIGTVRFLFHLETKNCNKIATVLCLVEQTHRPHQIIQSSVFQYNMNIIHIFQITNTVYDILYLYFVQDGTLVVSVDHF